MRSSLTSVFPALSRAVGACEAVSTASARKLPVSYAATSYVQIRPFSTPAAPVVEWNDAIEKLIEKKKGVERKETSTCPYHAEFFL